MSHYFTLQVSFRCYASHKSFIFFLKIQEQKYWLEKCIGVAERKGLGIVDTEIRVCVFEKGELFVKDVKYCFSDFFGGRKCLKFLVASQDS